MKISLFVKTFTTKACYWALVFVFITGAPLKADASILDSMASFIFGKGAQASEYTGSDSPTTEFGTDNFDYNSQTMQVLGTESVDPNTKNTVITGDVIIDNGAIVSDNSPIGMGLESVSNGEMATYIVKEGDTLSEIAEKFDISTNTIRWENNISGQTIKIGQKLSILPVTGVKHIVKSGDNLDKIAAKYDAEVQDVIVFNGVTKSDALKIGDILYVPNGIIKAVVVKATTSSKTSTASKIAVQSTSNVKVESGYYSRPTSGPITSPYGSRKGSFHYGIDIGVPRGTGISAAAEGVVVQAVNSCVEGRTSCGGRYGNYVVIQHSNGTLTRYAHLSRVSVSVGQSVSKSQKIGASGNTGHSTGPHLHFQVEKSNGSTIRPTF